MPDDNFWLTRPDYSARQRRYLTWHDLAPIKAKTYLTALLDKPAVAPRADEAAFFEAQDPAWKDLQRCRERDECLKKLRHLGIVKD